MLGISERSWYDWKRQAPARIGRDSLERVSYILGIWKALRELVPDQGAYRAMAASAQSRAAVWRAAADRAHGAGHVGDLYAVREWLDGWRG
jgi:hypothetical protein